MSTVPPPPPPATKPPLTVAGVNRLIARLNVDNDRFQNSPRPSALQKADAAERTNRVNSILTGLIAGLAPTAELTDTAAVAFWTVALSADFQVLTADWPMAPSGSAADAATGACFYMGGCIPSTQQQCLDLGGVFIKDGTC